jgi:carbonic anhydrase
MRTQAAALAGHRNMQMPPRYAHLALNHLRAGVQASEQRSPHQYPEVALSSEPSVSSVSRAWAGERVCIGAPNVKPMLTRSIRPQNDKPKESMKTLTKELQDKITPTQAIELLKEGNKRFVANLKINRNLLQQVNETTNGQHPFAVIISCMDSRTSAELIFDQGLGDIFSIRIAGNIINEDILGSAELGCKVVGAKVILVLGHTSCAAIKGAIDDVDLGHLYFITHKIQRCIPRVKMKAKVTSAADLADSVTQENVLQSILDLRVRSSVLAQMEHAHEIQIVGGFYDVSTGEVTFLADQN